MIGERKTRKTIKAAALALGLLIAQFTLVLMLIHGALPAVKADEPLPPSFDYLDKVTFLRNQGASPTCALHAPLHAFDIVKELEWPYTPDVSFRFENYVYQVSIGNQEYPQDSHVSGPCGGQWGVLQQYGGCPETLCTSNFNPPNTYGNPPPSDEAFSVAMNYAISSFTEISNPSLDEVKSYLYNNGPLTVNYLIPDHDVAFVGYDDFKQVFILVNSASFNGIQEMPYTQFQELSAQAKASNKNHEFLMDYVVDAPTPLPLVHPYTARICVNNPEGRRYLTVKIGVEGKEPVVVWDRNNAELAGVDLGYFDGWTDLCIDVPLPDYAANYWPPNYQNPWYCEVTDAAPVGGYVKIDEITFANRWVSSEGNKQVSTYEPWALPIESHGQRTLKLMTDSTPPDGSITITGLNGDPDFAKLRTVALSLNTYDLGSGLSEFRLKDGENSQWPESWQRFGSGETWSSARTIQWTLPGDADYKRVDCQVKDRAGNVFQCFDYIYFTDAKLTQIFFNFNQNPTTGEESVELKGIVTNRGRSLATNEDYTPVTGGTIEILYSHNGQDWITFAPAGFVYMNPETGVFSTPMALYPLEPSGGLYFKVRYVSDLWHIDSEASCYLRVTSLQIASPESLLFFNLNPVTVVYGSSSNLEGILLNDAASPISNEEVMMSVSFDDGASWEPLGQTHSNIVGFFAIEISPDMYAGHINTLIRANYLSQMNITKPIDIFKTAYLIVVPSPIELPVYPVLHAPRLPYLPLKGARYMPVEIDMQLPAGYDVNFIDTTSMAINDTMQVGPERLSFRDINSDGILDMSLTLNRTALSQFILSRNMTTGNVTLLLTGRFYDNVMFGGTMIVIVRMPGDINIDGRVDIKDLAQAAKSFGSHRDQPQWNPTADENEDGQIDIRDLVIICKKFGTVYT